MLRPIILGCASLLPIAGILSSYVEAVEPIRIETNDKAFQSYETNSILFKHTQDDDDASEINVSMRYYLKNELTDRIQPYQLETFFSYTGKLDFYWLGKNTRPSGPIVSRYQNPALHVRRNDMPCKIDSDGRDCNHEWWDAAVEHISNGQTLDAVQNRQLVLRANQIGDRATMDSISRTAATVAVTLERNQKLPALFDLENELNIKWYAKRFGQESEVFWGPHANENLDFNDFQILRFQWKVRLDNAPVSVRRTPRQFSAEMNIGKKGFSEESWNFALIYPIWVFPLTLTVHHGPMNNMSDYTKSQNTVAIGFAFAN